MWRCSSSTARRFTARRANFLSFPTTADITATTTLVAVARRRRACPSTCPISCAHWSTSPSLRTRARRAHTPSKDERPTAPPTAPRTTGERSRSWQRRDEGAVANFTHIGTALSALVLYLSDSNCCDRARRARRHVARCGAVRLSLLLLGNERNRAAFGAGLAIGIALLGGGRPDIQREYLRELARDDAAPFFGALQRELQASARAVRRRPPSRRRG